ncbi:MAG: hypothetical protein R3B70_20285 [Polyangiaceae bacterium]
MSQSSLEEELAKVDFAVQVDAHGSARGVDALIRALAAPSKRPYSDALSALRDRLCHGGFAQPVAPLAVPALVEVARAGGPASRDVLLFLHQLRARGPTFFDHALRSDAPLFPATAAVADAIERKIGPLLDLLSHEDAGVRAAAALVVAFTTSDPGRVRVAVEAAFTAEEDEAARACQILALGVLSRAMGVQDAAATLRRCLQEESPRIRAAAAIALAHLLPSPLDAGTLTALVAATTTPPEPDEPRASRATAARLPWNRGDLGSLAADVLGALGQAHPRPIIDALVRALVEISDAPSLPPGALLEQAPSLLAQGSFVGVDTRVSQALANGLVRVGFRRFEGRRGDEVVPDELSAEERVLLEILSLVPVAHDGPLYGLPFARDIPRFLGRRAGPLDLPMEGELPLRTAAGADSAEAVAVRACFPAWKWLRILWRKALSEQELARRCAARFDAPGLFALLLDATGGAYAMPGSDALLRATAVGAFVSALEPDLDALAPEIEVAARELLASASPERLPLARVVLVSLLCVASAGRRGAPLDPSLDARVLPVAMHASAETCRTVLEGLPEDRREALALRVIDAKWWQLLPMVACPTARLVEETVARIARWGPNLPRDRAMAALSALGPAVREPIERALRDKKTKHLQVLEDALAQVVAAPARDDPEG